MARVRVHQHVNPLAKFYREIPVEPLDPAAVFADPHSPIHIDIGCGRGRFLLEMSETRKNWNFVGMEIREPLVDEANEIAEKHKRNNLQYVFCNAPLDLCDVLENVPTEQVRLVTIQFPDPWFKKRHAKRRMVNEKLVQSVGEVLAVDGEVFVQTDVEELSTEIDELFRGAGFKGEVYDENILPVKTEREVSVENRNLPVYRFLYKK